MEQRPPQDASFAALHGLYWLAANLARERPLLLAIDDAQWSDDASLRYQIMDVVDQIERGEPCLLIRRRTWSGRQPVTAARLIHPGSRHSLEGRFHK